MGTDSVEVMFDYNYNTSDGKHIAISKGDRYTLLAKSTGEWWKVRKGDHEKFYVPANYVREVRSSKEMVDPTEKLHLQNNDHISIHSDIPSISMNGHNRTASGTSTGSDSCLDTQSCDSSLDSKGESSDKVSSLPRHSSHLTPSNGVSHLSSTMQDLQLNPSITVTPDSPCSPSDEPVAYANMEIIQEIIAQRKESVKNSSSDASDAETWEMHTDDDTGQVYYFNSVTKQTTWDSPVIKRRHRLERKNISSSPLNKRLSRVTSFRKGWTETIADDGSRIYVHNATGDKWYVASDASGKEYYYNESSQESLWELPEGGYTLRNAAQSSTTFDTHKKGYLHRAKLTEGRKRVKKNWSQAYIVAYENNLLIYKDEKSAEKKPEAEFGKPEAIIDLTHAIVDWSSKEKSARRNVLEVSSASGTCYLFQHDDNMLMHQWQTIILGKVKKFNPTVSDSPDSLNVPVPEPESNNNNDQKQNGLAKRKLHSRRFSKCEYLLRGPSLADKCNWLSMLFVFELFCDQVYLDDQN